MKTNIGQYAFDFHRKYALYSRYFVSLFTLLFFLLFTCSKLLGWSGITSLIRQEEVFPFLILFLLYEILFSVCDLDPSHQPKKLSIHPNASLSSRALNQYIVAHEPMSADLLECSSGSMDTMLNELQTANTRIRLLVQHPDVALNSSQRRKILSSLVEIVSKQYGTQLYENCIIKCYKTTPSLHGRLFDNSKLYLSWYLYQDENILEDSAPVVEVNQGTVAGKDKEAALVKMFKQHFEAIWKDPQTENLEDVLLQYYPYTVIFWDVDGVLMELESIRITNLTHVLAAYGIDFSAHDMHCPQTFNIPVNKDSQDMMETTMALDGAGDNNIYWWAVAQKPSLQAQLSLKDWNARLIALYSQSRERLTPHADVLRLLNKFSADHRVVQGIVTNTSKEQLNINLSVLGAVKDKIAVRITNDDVTNFKPNPEPYLCGQNRALEVLQARGVHTKAAVFIAVEDSPSGVQAALSSGIFCIQYMADAKGAKYDGHSDRLSTAYSTQEIENHLNHIMTNKENVHIPAMSN